jgi:uncharacterized membrane protein YoaK (UPF0700 family)
MDRLDRKRQALAIGLAALAGFVDASGFAMAGGYFVSFMSGNTTRLAVDIVSGAKAAALPAGLIAGFVAGVALGTVVSSRAGGMGKQAVLAAVTALLTGAALIAPHAFGAALALMVLAMGALNTAFRRDGEIAFGLTYMTGALVRLGSALGAALAGEPRPPVLAQMLLWFGLMGGAVCGAGAYAAWGYPALWIAAGGAIGFTGLSLIFMVSPRER